MTGIACWQSQRPSHTRERGGGWLLARSQANSGWLARYPSAGRLRGYIWRKRQLYQEHGLDGPRGHQLLARRAQRDRPGADGHRERPVAITEFGCCTYLGAADAGGRGFAILDISAHDRDSTPPRLNGSYIRDESEQARELTEMLSIFDAAGVDATFVMTFAAPLNPTSDDPLYDLDMASYSLVKSFGGRLGPLGAAHPGAPWDRGRLGTIYPGMRWEPKESFRAVADFYTAHTPPAPYRRPQILPA